MFAVLTVGFFSPVFLQDKTLSAIAGHQSIQYPWAAAPTGIPDAVQSDQANNVYPIQADLNRALRRGEFPFWSPYSFAGGPTLGTVYGSGFYPPRFLLSFVLAPIQVHDLFLLFHVWLAGMAVFVLTRRLGASWGAGLLAGVAWMFCPAWFGLAILEGAAVLASLLPLALWCMHRAVTRRSIPDAVACGVVLALFVLGASVQPAVFCFPIVCGWGLALAWRPRQGESRRDALIGAAKPVAVAAGLGMALCAFLVLPASAQISDSGRAALPYSTLARQDVGLGEFAKLIDGSPPARLTGDNVWTLTFVGLPIALFALAGCFSRRPGAGLGRVLVIVFGLLVVGTPLTRVAYTAVPGFAYLSPLGRLLPFFSFGVILLAAVGVGTVQSALARFVASPRQARILTAFGLVLVLGIAVEAWQVMNYSREVNPPFQPRDSSDLFPATGLIQGLQGDAQRLREHGDVQRLIAVRRGAPTDPFSPPTLVGEAPRLFSMETIGGYLNVLPPRSRVLSLILSGSTPAAAQQPAIGAYPAFYFSALTRYDLLERLGVDQLVTGPDVASDPAIQRAARKLGAQPAYAGADGTLLRLPGASRRAFVVEGVERAGSPDAALRRFIDPAFPYQSTVVLDGAAAQSEPERAATAPIDARVRVLPGSSAERNIDVVSPKAGWLVVLDSFAKGWSATVAGRKVPVRRADYAYRAVRVPAGHSIIEMRYRTPGLLVGSVVSIAAVFAGLALLILPRIRRRS